MPLAPTLTPTAVSPPRRLQWATLTAGVALIVLMVGLRGLPETPKPEDGSDETRLLLAQAKVSNMRPSVIAQSLAQLRSIPAASRAMSVGQIMQQAEAAERWVTLAGLQHASDTVLCRLQRAATAGLTDSLAPILLSEGYSRTREEHVLTFLKLRAQGLDVRGAVETTIRGY